MKVSVIVPVYNAAAFLPQCLDSILAQTEPDIEVLLVDDGSTDESAAVLADYAARDGRCRYLHKQNGGLSSARNAGMTQATGTYLLFVDADDWIEPTLVADAWAAAEEHRAEQVLWNYRKAYSSRVDPPYLPLKAGVIDVGKLGLPGYFYRYWFSYVHGQEAWSKLYRRDVIEANGLAFAPNDEIFAEDTLFSATYLLHTRTMVVLEAPYVYYRQRADGLMGAPKPRLALRLITLSIRYAEYARRAGQGRALRNVLPMLLYQLAAAGLAGDPCAEDAARALLDTKDDATLRGLLRGLLWGAVLPAYLLHTGKGFRTQLRGRAFAWAWLRGRTGAALRLAGRKELQVTSYELQEGSLLSVVMPCHNAAPYLEEALASVCAQALPQAVEMEVIAVDDGSTDGSGPLLAALAARDPRIRVISQANVGVSAARNAGLDAARGDFVAFVDADDLLLPGALAILYGRIAADPALDIVSARHRERYPGGGSRVFKPGKRCRRRGQALARLIEGDSVYNSMCNKLYRRALLERWHVRAQPGLRIGEDALFNLEAYARAGKAAHLRAVTYEYRIHGASAMRGIPAAEHYARHLPWLAGMRAVLARLGLREAFFRPYAYSHALRLYKSVGFIGVLRAFNREVRPAALEGIDKGKLRWSARPMYAAMRAGLFPAVYCVAFPALRARDAAKRAGRWIAYLARLPLRRLRKKEGGAV
ncbi:MAG: glycosyltransferase [Clostridia bacterium]|nr:glycosyltransferase [Clostridia bacterium]